MAALTDSVELEWIISRFEISSEDVIVDVGCGTGRHSIGLSQNTNAKAIFACDFVKKNIDFLNDQAKTLDLNNLHGIVCNGSEFAKI